MKENINRSKPHSLLQGRHAGRAIAYAYEREFKKQQ